MYGLVRCATNVFRRGTNGSTTSRDSHPKSDPTKKSSWIQASGNIGPPLKSGYEEFALELNKYRKGEGYDLWYRMQDTDVGEELIAIIYPGRPEAMDVNVLTSRAIGTASIKTADLKNKGKISKFWDTLNSLVKPETETGSWNADWQIQQ